MAADVDLTRSKVQAYLTEIGPVTLDRDGDFSLRYGSARVFVRVQAHPNKKWTLVRVFALVLQDVPLTPELYKYVATFSESLFGTLLVVETGDGVTGRLVMREILLGNFLDAEELKTAVYGIAYSTDDLDDELATKFGGTVFHE